MVFWTAFSLGLLGSLHCLGMCAPIAIAIPYAEDGQRTRWLGGLLYNSGRLVTYMALGLILGLIGRGLSFAGLQQFLCVLIGITFLGVALFSINLESWLVQRSFLSPLYQKLSKQLARQLAKPSYSALLMIGSLNGLLPCGLVYMALFGALNTATPLAGMSFMLAFGLGTFPLMLLASWAGPVVKPFLRSYYRRLVPIICLVFGLFFLYRGIQFHLPENFFIWGNLHSAIRCH